MSELTIRNATIVSAARPAAGLEDVHVAGNTIHSITPASDAPVGDDELDASGCFLIPGLIQCHVHFCQTIFRGIADDMDVIEWLFRRIWPLEQAHDHTSLGASAELAVAELLLGGTTCALSMETVRHTDASFEAAEALGIRAFIGKAIMDQFEPGTDMIGEDSASAWAEIERLIDRWHGAGDGRLHYALSPRAPISATDETWRRCVELAEELDLVLHTHVNENGGQAELVVGTGRHRDVAALHEVGALTPRMVMAHAVWLDDHERDLLREHHPNVCHCPSANMKLASGRAPVPEYLADGVNVALGADGAACNNRLDAFTEMRLAALVHKPAAGPTAMPAAQVFEMATLGGARALGLGDRLGAVEVGRLADLVLVERSPLHVYTTRHADPFSTLVYASTASDVRDVVVDGRLVVRDHELLSGDVVDIAERAERELDALLDRAQLVA